MTHEANIDDGDLELEAWEQADAELAAGGMDEYDRIYFWRSLMSPEQLEHERLIGAVQEEENCSAAEAHRILHALNGITI